MGKHLPTHSGVDLGFELSLGIYKPFRDCKNLDVIICSWNVSGPQWMSHVVDILTIAKSVTLIVGNVDYNEHTLKAMDAYRDCGWTVLQRPRVHSKIWLIGKKAYIGSMNFVPESPVRNIMVPADFRTCFNHIKDLL